MAKVWEKINGDKKITMSSNKKTLSPLCVSHADVVATPSATPQWEAHSTNHIKNVL